MCTRTALAESTSFSAISVVDRRWASTREVVFDGTSLQCQGTAASGTITISSTARTITLRILGNQPSSVRRDNVVLPEQGTPKSGVPGWRYDAAASFIEIDLTHAGGTTIIEY